MATLEKIRNRAGVGIAIIIGLALASFILGDLFKSSSSILRGKQMELAEIKGNTVTYPEFQAKVDELSEIYKMNSGRSSLDQQTVEQIREQSWQNMVRNLAMKQTYENLGIGVSSQELFDMVQGKNPHPIIQSIFRDPNTGQINRPALIQFLKYQQSNSTGKERAYWLFIENQIIEERLFTKYNNLLAKGIYITSEEAKADLSRRNHQAGVQYVGKAFTAVADNSVSVTEAELKEYYDKNKEKFKQENSRTIEYVSFPVIPSKSDEDKLVEWANKIKPEFASVEDPTAFVNLNSDVPFDGSYFKQRELSPELGAFAFSGKIGDVFGPYKEKNSWKLAKIQRFEQLPDSVQARHILIRVNSQEELARATKTIDSLKNLIVVKGMKFEDVARAKSDDTGSANNGGDLGWVHRGMMVKPFEEAAFLGKVNDIQVVRTQYGLHLLQVTNRGKTEQNVQLAVISRNIEPSSQTYQATYAKASKFASENADAKKFTANISSQGLDKKIANVRENDKDIAGLDNSRTLIRAAYKAKPGELIVGTEGTPIFEFNSVFVIGVVSSEQKEGIASLNAVKSRVEAEVKKLKKAKQLVDQMAGKTDLSSLASTLGTSVGEAQNITFDSYSFPGVGFEPAIAGASSVLQAGQTSKPVVGATGVYVVRVNTVNQGNDQDIKTDRQRLAASIGYRTSMLAFEAIREDAKIVDKRAKFY